MKFKVSAVLNRSKFSLDSDHEKKKTKERCDREDAKDQIEQHEGSDKKEVSVCDIWLKSMEERHDKVETKGESYKNIVINSAEMKIEICHK